VVERSRKKTVDFGGNPDLDPGIFFNHFGPLLYCGWYTCAI